MQANLNNGFSKRLKSMIAVDFRRMFTTPLFYIMAGICLAIPILILVMTTSMGGAVDPVTGTETAMQGFTNVWQIIGTTGEGGSGGMDILSMCNINLLYFGIAVLVGLFVSADFKSGYAKNLFTVRSDKKEYVISKTVVCFMASAILILTFVIGAVLGGGISSLSFALEGISIGNLIACIISKVLICLVFVPIYLAVSVVGKQKTWICIVGSLAVGMLMFSMIPMITPINATIMNIILCLAGGAMFSIGLGAVSNLVLKKRDII